MSTQQHTAEGETHTNMAQTIRQRFARMKISPRVMSTAILDQALFAGTNFVINVLLARWMLRDEYGAFVVVYSWFLLSQNLYDAILIEPMTIFGAGKYSDRFRKYLGYVYYGHVLISIFAVIGLLIGAAIAAQFDSGMIATTMVGAALAAPFILTRWLTRQPFYVMSRPIGSVYGGVIYLLLSVLVIFGLHQVGHVTLLEPFVMRDSLTSGGTVFWLDVGTLLTPTSALFVMGITGLIASGVLTVTLIKPNFNLSDDKLSVRGVIADHMQYGRWSSVDRILGWVPSNIYYLMLPVLVGLEASGALRALNNLVMPLYMAMIAMTAVILPSFVRTYHTDGKAGLHRRMRIMLILFVGITVASALVITLFGGLIVNVAFAGKYDDVVTLPILITMGILPISVGITTVLDAGLRAMRQVRYAFISRLLPTLMTFTVGLFLTAQFGILGVNIAILINGVITISQMTYFHYRASDAQPDNETSSMLSPAETLIASEIPEI